MRSKTVILANGDFPRKGGVPYKVLANAKRVIACDGAVMAYHRAFKKWPEVVVGDFDSAKPPFGSALVVKCTDDSLNDLEKAIVYAKLEGWRKLVIVGASGKREDHTIGNIFRALEYGIEIVTESGVFYPCLGKKTFKAGKNAGVSIFTTNSKAKMESAGLKWPLKGVEFTLPYVATLNRATGSKFTITTDSPTFVFIEVKVGEKVNEGAICFACSCS